MSDNASYKYDQNDHIFVHIANSSVYKTKIIDRRIIKRVHEDTVFIKIEYQVKNTSKDCPTICWVDEEKCFNINEYNKIINLDNGI